MRGVGGDLQVARCAGETVCVFPRHGHERAWLGRGRQRGQGTGDLRGRPCARGDGGSKAKAPNATKQKSPGDAGRDTLRAERQRLGRSAGHTFYDAGWLRYGYQKDEELSWGFRLLLSFRAMPKAAVCMRWRYGGNGIRWCRRGVATGRWRRTSRDGGGEWVDNSRARSGPGGLSPLRRCGLVLKSSIEGV